MTGERAAARCPRCAAAAPEPLEHTWWGGTLGARLRHRVRCCRCGLRFNGRTGSRDLVGIYLYLSAVLALAGAAAALVVLTL